VHADDALMRALNLGIDDKGWTEQRSFRFNGRAVLQTILSRLFG
jgi:hypothetical protein